MGLAWCMVTGHYYVITPRKRFHETDKMRNIVNAQTLGFAVKQRNLKISNSSSKVVNHNCSVYRF